MLENQDFCDEGAVVRRWKENLANPRDALAAIGQMMVAESQQAFVDQEWSGKKWKKRGVPNVMGIIADLAAGSKPPNRRFEDSPVLRDTGRLMSSITYRVVSNNRVLIGSNLPYAGVLNYGGESQSEPITKTVVKNLYSFLKSERGGKWKKELGWIFNKKFRDKRITANIEARPFLGVTKALQEDVAEVLHEKIFKS